MKKANPSEFLERFGAPVAEMERLLESNTVIIEISKHLIK